MKLHYESVSSSLLSSLQKMMLSEVFADFRLVGGTALSLQRGHRRSIDIDLFTDVEYGNMPLDKIRGFIQEAFPMHLKKMVQVVGHRGGLHGVDS